MDAISSHLANQTFKRGQVAWALWACINGASLRPALGGARLPLASVPASFTRRIAKFIELGVPFEERQRPGRRGTDLSFTVADVFELGIALDLQDVGLNALEIAQWTRRNRAAIRGITSDLSTSSAAFLVIRNRMVGLPRLHQGEPFGENGMSIGALVFVNSKAGLQSHLAGLAGMD